MFRFVCICICLLSVSMAVSGRPQMQLPQGSDMRLEYGPPGLMDEGVESLYIKGWLGKAEKMLNSPNNKEFLAMWNDCGGNALSNPHDTFECLFDKNAFAGDEDEPIATS